jgi:hypothetical protein
LSGESLPRFRAIPGGHAKVLTAQRIGMFALVAALLGASTIAVALLLRFVLRGRDSTDALDLPPWRKGRRVEEVLRFVSGPFPVSLVLHLGVLLFLMARVIEPAAPPPLMVRMESGGGGGGGGEPSPKLPELPDVAMAETEPLDVENPPQITLPHLAALPLGSIHSNDYIRSTSPGGFGPGTGGGSGTGTGGGIGSGYGRGMGPGFGGFVNTLRSKGLDMVLVIDGTSSMRFVIDDVKARMKGLVLAIHGLVPAARIGIVQFGGAGERIAMEPFAPAPQPLLTFLTAIKAKNGGEWQEDTLAAVKAAVEQMAWRPRAKKVIVLVGDTPALEQDEVEVLHLVEKFHAEDGTFNTVDVTAEEHERFARKLYYFIHHRDPTTIPPPWEFDEQTQHSYQEMAKVGGGEWSSLTKDPAVNQQVLILAFGRHWESQAANVVPPAVSSSH